MYYINNNFKDAFNYEDLMDPILTEIETDNLQKSPMATGCYEFLRGRCIDNIALEKRPFHCVDEARLKFILRTNNKWLVDRKGEEILKQMSNKIKEVFMVNHGDDTNTILLKNKRFREYFEDMYKVLDYILDDVNLRNNMIKGADEIDKKPLEIVPK
jgi:hypothetical protein